MIFLLCIFQNYFHPLDPTVKRRSPFLISKFIKIQIQKIFLNYSFFFCYCRKNYATFSPRLYANDKILLQTEYRQKFNLSNNILTLVILQKKIKMQNHCFYKYDRNFDFDNFDDNEINLKIQKTSNDTYLKTNKLKSQIFFNDNDILENSLGLSF